MWRRLGYILILLTCPLALAAPDSTLDLSNIKSEEKKQEDESLKDLSVVTPDERPPRERRYKYSGAFVFEIGQVIRPQGTGQEEILGYLYGLQFQTPSNGGSRWEFGGAIVDDNVGELLFGYRYIFDLDAKVRPQLRAALSSLLPEGASSVEFFSIANWHANFALGLENRTWSHGAFRIEVGGIARPGNIEARLNVGFIWHYSGKIQRTSRPQ